MAEWEARTRARASRGTCPNSLESNRCKARNSPDWTTPRFARTERGRRRTHTRLRRVKAKRVTAVRLELLTDDSLPHKGPGRCDNGNLHLSEITLTAATVKEARPQTEIDRAAKPKLRLRSAGMDGRLPSTATRRPHGEFIRKSASRTRQSSNWPKPREEKARRNSRSSWNNSTAADTSSAGFVSQSPRPSCP